MKISNDLVSLRTLYQGHGHANWNDSQAIVDRKIAKTGNKMKCFIAISSISKFYGLNHREFRFLHGRTLSVDQRKSYQHWKVIGKESPVP